MPEIKKTLSRDKLRWNNKIQSYAGLDGKVCGLCYPVNLAWYSFQEVHKELLEQQKKIERLMNVLSERSMYDKVSGNKIIFVNEVKEILSD